MRVRVLGCSGGIGGGRHTTSLLVDDDILIDAGSGVTRLSLEELSFIQHLFLTHTHLDHIHALPIMLDSVGVRRTVPLQVHALPEVIEILKDHIFNWEIWPDFASVPTQKVPFMQYMPLGVGDSVKLGEREIIAIPARHGRPAIGYMMRGKRGSLIFSGDTTSHAELIDLANATEDLLHFVVEVSFDNDHQYIAELADHFCPAILLPDLAKLKPGVPVWITHLKPGEEDSIMSELMGAGLPCGDPRALVPDQTFDL